MAEAALINLELPELPAFKLPPLPEIPNKALERKAFVHSSLYAKPRDALSFVWDDHDVIEDNEKLEHIGDAILGAIVTNLLHRLYPKLKHGPASILRSQLVRNKTISQLAWRYNLPGRLKASPGSAISILKSDKTIANVFEAYVAAYYQSRLVNAGTHGGPHHTGLHSPPETPDRVRTDPRPALKRKHELSSSVAGDAMMTAESTNGAFEMVAAWLDPLFTPLAYWALEILRDEKDKLNQRFYGGEDGDIDTLAERVSAILNERFIRKFGAMPAYDCAPAESGSWRCVVTVYSPSLLSEEATRSTKQKAKAAAAYKICLSLGLIERA